MKTKSETGHQTKLAELEIRYDQILDQLIDDIITKIDLVIEEDDSFKKLYKIQRKMESVKRKMVISNIRGDLIDRL